MMEEAYFTHESGEPLSMQSPLSAIVHRRPITVAPTASLRSALELMDRERIGAIVVVDLELERPRGIFTLQDLLRRVALKEVGLDAPVAEVMTRNLVTVRPQQTAYQAAVLMARRNIRHMLVTDHQGHLVGVVSQGDLYALQRAGVRELSSDIRRAEDIGALKVAALGINRLAHAMLRNGLSAESITHFISTLNDLLTIRVIELTEVRFKLPAVAWCWISLGSEGRLEQTLATDQDNGIIFAAEAGADCAALREAFLPFAREVNEQLDACGFPLCKGEVMASNPQWCLSLGEWKHRFGNWMQESQPQALLNASIFFDFRPLYGAEDLAEDLRAWLLERAPGHSLFLRLMAQNALECAPPLGMIRDFVFDGDKDFPHTIELKKFGARIFVDAARIFALAHGISHTNTAQRLRAVAQKLSFAKEDLDAAIDGFYFIQSLRLRNQMDAPQEGAANRVNPDDLNELDRHVLKESFKQAKKLQTRLSLDYRL